MKARVKWIENMAFVGETDSGHAVVIDGPESLGGRNLGPRPMELMLLSVGACSSVDVMMILKKARQNVRDCWVEIDGKRADSEPAVFTDIHLHFVVVGEDLKENQVKRAVDLSAEKYFSASIMLGKSATMTHDYEVRSAATSA